MAKMAKMAVLEIPNHLIVVYFTHRAKEVNLLEFLGIFN